MELKIEEATPLVELYIYKTKMIGETKEELTIYAWKENANFTNRSEK